MWDIANTLRIVKRKARPLCGLATDDTHGYHENKPNYSPGRWLMVKARHLMAASIVRGIRAAEMGGVLNVARQLVVTARRVYIGHQPVGERKNRPSRIELRGEARAVDGEKWAIA